MRTFTILSALLCLAVGSFAQNAEDENIKKTIQAESDAIVSRNLDAWKATWQQDANAFTTFASHFGYNTRRGWDSILAAVQRDWAANPKSDIAKMNLDNYTIRTNGNMAIVDYDAMITPVDVQADIFPYNAPFKIHNYETLVKEGDQWKIASRIITQPESYSLTNDHDTETDINAMGYRLLAAKKMNEAIEILKLNTKLFPNSFNTFDSLGEAYALAGNKKAAIENYEKSMKLNPKNDNGTTALAKLKQK